MKITAILAAAIIAGSASMAMAQSGSGAAGGAGSDVSTPRKNMQRPTKNSPTASRRGDDMPAGMNAVPTNKQAMGMQGEGQKMGMHKGKKKMGMKKHMGMKKNTGMKKNEM